MGAQVATALVDAAAWAALSVVVGLTANRVPLARFEHEGWLTRLRRVERGGRVYDGWLRIRTWKDLVPEAGALGVGFPKRQVGARDTTTLLRFVAETRRAEAVHWVLLACGPLFLLWNRGLLAAAMLLYALGANVPCIMIQRYNRGRLQRVLAARARRRGPGADG
jgi:glycosyl-4,4'-diaponeurosporenoate acyltransferase